MYSTRREGSRAALIRILLDTTRNEADDEIEASESFILVTSMVFVGNVVELSSLYKVKKLFRINNDNNLKIRILVTTELIIQPDHRYNHKQLNLRIAGRYKKSPKRSDP